VSADASDNITVIINGKVQSYDQSPVIKNGSTLVPLRGIFESLGATINYESSTQTVTGTKGKTTVVLQIGSETATKNDSTVTLAQSAQIVNGRTMVPLRFIGEALGAQLSWDGTTKTVTITSSSPTETSNEPKGEDTITNREEDSAENSIHNYTKEEMKSWIDKDADLIRLDKYPIASDFHDTLAEANASELGLDDPRFDPIKTIIENRYNPLVKYMDTYYNRDYRTIGDEWIKGIRHMYRTDWKYKGDVYDARDGELPMLFDRFVQETKDNNWIMESIFVTDLSMVFHQQINGKPQKKIRGTQYIRYSSGTNLPEGLELNKWYKRDIDVVLWSPSYGSRVAWDTSPWVLDVIDPITFYQEVNINEKSDTSTIDVGFMEEPNVHELSKEEFTKKIDKEADLEILRDIPIQSEHFDDDLTKTNEWVLKNRVSSNGYEYIKEDFYKPVVKYMDTYYNRDYRTIGEQYKEDISFFYRHTTNYRGFKYSYTRNGSYVKGNLEDLFDQIVQDTKDEKRISESIFVTDTSMVYETNLFYKQPLVRGMQYIRYTSGTNLPKGVELNKWYKRAIDVKFAKWSTVQETVEKAITWDTAKSWYDGIYPKTSYEEVLGGKPRQEKKTEYRRYVYEEILESIPVAANTGDETWFILVSKFDVVPKNKDWKFHFDSPYEYFSAEVMIKRHSDGETFSPSSLTSTVDTLKVYAPSKGYQPGETYTIYINNAKTKSGAFFKPTKLEFTIKEETAN
jgi:hypothetical protein